MALPRHHYSPGVICLVVQGLLVARAGQRCLAAVLGLVARLLPGMPEVPCANTGRMWLLRLGLYELRRPKPKADDWVWILDHTVQLGGMKALIIVGIRLSQWEEQRGPLRHEDLTVLDVMPMRHSSGRAVEARLEAVAKQAGAPRAIVGDGGTDLKCGIASFQKTHHGVARLYDIKHKMALLLQGQSPVAARRLRERIQTGRTMLPSVRDLLSEKLATYVRLVMVLLCQAELGLSPRRGGMLLRNVLAVHTARLLVEPDANLRESALLALTHSFPQRALGVEVSRIKVLKCHREAWQAAALDADDPRRLLMMEPDPLRRALRAAQVTSLSQPEFSGIVADCLASLRPGSRHALATALFESGAAGNLVAAVAE
ncbi:MAG: hypothetical protein ABSG86_24440 [Thermoguttaceae bacterium]|jgi:hypothetical protein